MPHSLLIQFEKHPKERDLVGQIILAYGELEFMLLDMLRAALGDNLITAVRTLYRLKSESNRMSVADALVRPHMEAHGLLAAYQEAHDAMHHCKQIRNRYAHAPWASIDGVLRCGDLDKAALTSGTKTEIKLSAIPLPLLEAEFEYFKYAEHALIYATNQLRQKTNQPLPLAAVIPKPKKMQLPTLDSLAAKLRRQHIKTALKRPR